MNIRFLVVMVAAAACGRAQTREPAKELPRVQVKLASAGAGQGEAWVAGTVQAAQRATVSTRVAARVRAVAVQEGARVQAGALLVQLDDDDLRQQLRAAETALASAQAHERRMTALVASRTAPQSDLDMARPARAQAEAQVAAARAALAYTGIRAPFAGVVQAKHVQPGDFVGPGQPLIDLEGGGLEISASLTEEEARGIRTGDRLRFDAEGREGSAEVIALTAGADPVSHRGLLRAKVLDGEGLRSGAFARLRLPSAAPSEGAWVPKTALVERGDLTGVFVAQNGRAELRWVSLGDASGALVPVRAGLRAGERVVDRPGDLRDGQPVEVTGGN
jgi:RND family efflux transporter MFP subunit